MIIGIGQDICDVNRINSTLSRFGSRFINRIYTFEERKRGFEAKYINKIFGSQMEKKIKLFGDKLRSYPTELNLWFLLNIAN